MMSKLEKLSRIIRTTLNWYEVLAVYLGFKKSCIAKLRSGKKVLVSKDKWGEFWQEITKEAISSKLKLKILENSLVLFEFKGNRILLRFPDSINYGAILEVYYLEKYRKLQVKDRVVVDIGAYIGDTVIYFTLRGAKRVLAVEPFPFTYEILRENLRLNNITNVELINAALWSKDGVIYLPTQRMDTFETSVSSLISITSTDKVSSSKANYAPVKTYTLDSFGDEYRIPEGSILKLDCEGCKYHALLASENTLAKFSEIMLEYHGDPSCLVKHLKKAGFKYVKIWGDRNLGILLAKKRLI